MNDKRERAEHDDEYIIIRKFSLKLDNEERAFTHLQYTGWTDFGVPDQPIGILQIVHHADEAAKYHQLRNNEVGPMTIHCSAGCGRSGTFCVIDTIIQRLWHERDVYTSTSTDKIKQTVSRFREQRMSMVQTHRQFIFCYEAILWWLLGYGYLPASSSPLHIDPSFMPKATPATLAEPTLLPLFNGFTANSTTTDTPKVTQASTTKPPYFNAFPITTSKAVEDDERSSSIGSIVDDFKDL